MAQVRDISIVHGRFDHIAAAGAAKRLPPQRHHPFHRQRPVHRAVLRQVGQRPRPHPSGHLAKRHTVKRDATRRRCHQPRQPPQQRRFPRPIRPNHADQVTGVKVK